MRLGLRRVRGRCRRRVRHDVRGSGRRLVGDAVMHVLLLLLLLLRVLRRRRTLKRQEI